MRSSCRIARNAVARGQHYLYGSVLKCRLFAKFATAAKITIGISEMRRKVNMNSDQETRRSSSRGNVESLNRFQASLASTIKLASQGDCHKAISDFYSAVTELPHRFDPHQQCSEEIVQLLELIYTSEDFDADDFPILMDALYKCKLESNRAYPASLLTLKFVHQNIDAILGITFDLSNRRVAYYVLLMVISLREPFQNFFRTNMKIDLEMLTSVRRHFIDKVIKDHMFANTEIIDQIKMVRACVESKVPEDPPNPEEAHFILGVITELVGKTTTQYDMLQLLMSAQALDNLPQELATRLEDQYLALGKSSQGSLSVKMLSPRDLYYIVALIEKLNNRFPMAANTIIKQLKWRMSSDKTKFAKLARAWMDLESPLINSIKFNEMTGILRAEFEPDDFHNKNMIILLNIMLEEARRRQDTFYGSRFTLDVASKLMDFLNRAPLRILELNSFKNLLSNMNRLLPTQGYIDRMADVLLKMLEGDYHKTEVNYDQLRKIPVILHSFLNSFLDPTHPVLPKLVESFFFIQEESRTYMESKGKATYVNLLSQLTCLWMLKLQTYPEAIKRLPHTAQVERLAQLENEKERLTHINQLLRKLVNDVFQEFKNLTDLKYQFSREELTSIIELSDSIVDLKFFSPDSKEFKRAKKVTSQLQKVLGISFEKPTAKTHKFHKPGDQVDWLHSDLISTTYHSTRARFLDEITGLLHKQGIKFFSKVTVGVYEASFYIPEYNLFIFTVGPAGVSTEYDCLIPKFELRQNCVKWKGYNAYTMVAQYELKSITPENQLKLALESCIKHSSSLDFGESSSN